MEHSIPFHSFKIVLLTFLSGTVVPVFGKLKNFDKKCIRMTAQDDGYYGKMELAAHNPLYTNCSLKCP